MTATLIDGKAFAATVRARVGEHVARLTAEHGITPTTVRKDIPERLAELKAEADALETSVLREARSDYDVREVIRQLEAEMVEAAGALEFERAALLRDQLRELEGADRPAPVPRSKGRARPDLKTAYTRSRGKGRRKAD